MDIAAEPPDTVLCGIWQTHDTAMSIRHRSGGPVWDLANPEGRNIGSQRYRWTRFCVGFCNPGVAAMFIRHRGGGSVWDFASPEDVMVSCI